MTYTPHESTQPLNMAECIDDCLMSFRLCEEEFFQCLLRGEEYLNAAHLQLLQTCAAICETSARFMMMHSPYHTRVCGVCATVCDACADSCDNFTDKQSRDCSAACRRCARSCEKLALLSH